VVTARVGESNRWDAHLGARSLSLATWDELAHLADADVEIGAHSRTHPKLTSLAADELDAEVAGAAADLVARGYTPRLFAYPHGDHDRRVESIADSSGFEVAFTVTPGIARSGVGPHRVPRLEVLPDDRGRRLLRKVRLGGRWSLLWTSWRRHPQLLAGEARRVQRGVRRRLRRLGQR
jgi:peptidoglycan/xylan/chitin deacetylase (PgdA/CDA1 family)